MPRCHPLLRPRRLAQTAPLALAAFFYLTGSTRIAYQDIASLMAQQPAVAERARERMIASPFGTIHAAVFSLPRPIGTQIPGYDPASVARFDASANPAGVNRGGKGDLQVPRIQIQILAELLREDADEPANNDAENLEASLDFKPFARFDPAMVLDPQQHAEPAALTASADGDSEEARAQERELYFGGKAALASLPGLEPWNDDDLPRFDLPRPAIAEAPADALPVIRVSAPAVRDDEPRPAIGAVPGSSVVQRALQTPAERLRLTGKTRTKAEKCLATAIYFEARSEPVRGQIAVAQVIVNRAFSGYYPEDICGVVYQNAHRHLSCQFTFACDGIPDVVTEREHWARAERIATASLDGKIWLDDVGLATHYHASYVYPYWVRSMRKLKKIGLHTFYRPRKWGEDAAPTWTTPAAAELVAKM